MDIGWLRLLRHVDGAFEKYVLRVEWWDKVSDWSLGGEYVGVRPVVCIPSDITANWNEIDKVWCMMKK